MAAVRSVLSQRHSPADAGMIVVKTFHDPEIDRFGLFARPFVCLVAPGVAARLLRPSVGPPASTHG
jgi:hypothetical protein